MKIKTANEIIKESTGFLHLNMSKENLNSLENKIKEYAAQFIDLAAEKVIKITNTMNEPYIEKEVILNLKKQIK